MRDRALFFSHLGCYSIFHQRTSHLFFLEKTFSQGSIGEADACISQHLSSTENESRLNNQSPFIYRRLGSAKRITVDKDNTTIVDGGGTRECLIQRMDELFAGTNKAVNVIDGLSDKYPDSGEPISGADVRES